jgi:hypothetical protein
MDSTLDGEPSRGSGGLLASRWAPLPLYLLFALAVFVLQGIQPVLGPDHISYFQLADSIREARPDGDYWRETNSVRSFGVLLAYLYPLTGSHLVSMKAILVVTTVLYLIAADLFFSLFTTERWQAVLLTVLSAFAVSFGIGSWGVTDSTALLPRSLVAPFVMVALWMWLRFRDSWVKYLAFSVLVCGSLLHLSTLHVMGILGLLEAWDFVANRKLRIDWRIPACLGGLALAFGLLFAFEVTGLSVKLIHSAIPKMFSAKVFAIPDKPPETIAGSTRSGPSGTGRGTRAAAGTPPSLGLAGSASTLKVASPKDAWDLELSLRPWRNMPLPAANVANVLSSFALILVLALVGVQRARRAGFSPTDRVMAALFVVVPVFAFGPQTLLWLLRSISGVYPATIEEVRAIGFIMIPALYFVLRLVQSIPAGDNRRLKVAAIVLGVLALPLGLKALPNPAREALLSVMMAVGAVDAKQESSVNNARVALGILHTTPFYYSTLGSMEWLRRNARPGNRVLTDRDEFVLLRELEVVGPRQVAGVPDRAGVEMPAMAEVFFKTRDAIQSRDQSKVGDLAATYGADYYVVPWAADGASYRDEYFSVVPVPR